MPSTNSLSYGDRVRVNGADGRVISRGSSGPHGSVTVETPRGTTTLTGYDRVFRRRLDSYGPGRTPSYHKWTGR